MRACKWWSMIWAPLLLYHLPCRFLQLISYKAPRSEPGTCLETFQFLFTWTWLESSLRRLLISWHLAVSIINKSQATLKLAVRAKEMAKAKRNFFELFQLFSFFYLQWFHCNLCQLLSVCLLVKLSEILTWNCVPIRQTTEPKTKLKPLYAVCCLWVLIEHRQRYTVQHPRMRAWFGCALRSSNSSERKLSSSSAALSRTKFVIWNYRQ